MTMDYKKLPQPVTREELFLAKIIGMQGFDVPTPATRVELFLAKILGQNVELPMPVTSVEMYLAKWAGEIVTLPDEAVTRVEKYLANVVGETVTLPENPSTRTEAYLAFIGGTEVTAIETSNGMAAIENTIEGANMYDLKLKGDTSQQTYSGKNLLKISAATRNGVTTTLNADGSITCSGTTNTAYFNVTGYQSDVDKIMPAGTYTYSRTKDNTYASVCQLWNQDKTDYIALTIPVGSNSVTADVPFDVHFYNVAFTQVGSGTSVDFTATLQLESGSAATAFESYVGGIPSPNPDYPQDVQVVTGEQTVDMHGKNLFDISSFHGNTHNGIAGTVEPDGGITIAGTSTAGTAQITSTVPIKLNAGTYTFSVAEALLVNFYLHFLLADGTTYHNILIQAGSISATVSLPQDTLSANLRVSGFSAGTTLNTVATEIQLEAGSTATAYEPYQGGIYTIDLDTTELCKIGDYQDYIYKGDDGWYLHKGVGKYTLPTSGYTLWSTHTDACMYYKNYNVPGALFANGSTALMCEQFVCKAQISNLTDYYNNYHGDGYGITLKTQTPGIAIQNIDQTSLSDFHTWISNNPVTLYYALATPTDTQINNAALIEQLEALAGATMCDGITYITISPSGDNLAAVLSAKTRTELSE